MRVHYLRVLLLEARLRDREEEGAIKAVLLAVLAHGGLGVGEHVASAHTPCSASPAHKSAH